MPNFSGLGNSSLNSSAWTMFYVIVGWTGSIIVAFNVLHSLNKTDVLDVLIFRMLVEWFEVMSWTVWLITIVWGFIALSLPARPRATKKAALWGFVFLIVCHIVAHSVFIFKFCRICHSFFVNSLAGNVIKATVETMASRFAQREFVQDFMHLTVPVANWVSAPYVFRLLLSMPPTAFFFWIGWNWALAVFILGILPVICFMTAIVVVMGLIHAVERGGNGNENVAPSKIALFYALDPEDRADVRSGFRKVDEFAFSSEEVSGASSGSTSEVEGSGGTKSSSLRSYTDSDVEQGKDAKRIPSYKPNRTRLIV